LSGAEVITLSDPLYGDAQSEAALRVGYVRIRDVEPGEIIQINLVGEVDAAKRGVGASDDYKGLLARMNALEAENAQLKQGATPDQSTQVPGGEQAKVDGANAVNAQASTTDVAPVQNVAPLDGVAGNTATTAPVAPVNPADASVTGGSQPTPTTPVGGPATGEALPVTPTSDVSAATSQEAQLGAAQAAAGNAPSSDQTPVSPADASNATPVATNEPTAPATDPLAPSAPVDPADTDEASEVALLPLADQSTDELKATASAENVDVTGLNSNEELVNAIQTKRNETPASNNQESEK
jgi:hypothetical protein